MPTTALAPPRDPGPLRSAARRIGSYGWIVITSRNAVPPLKQALSAAGVEIAGFSDAPEGRPRVCAVGPGTALALERAGFPVDLIPERFTAAGVVEALAGRVEGVGVLYPRAEGAREVIPRELGALGARVDAVDGYRTVGDGVGARALARGVDRGEVDVITFAAGSAARSFAQAWREGGAPRRWPEQVGVIAIGPVTARALETAGLPVHGTGEPHTLEGLVAAVEAWARERNG
jgi:uroporphyrinogen-III synthase